MPAASTRRLCGIATTLLMTITVARVLEAQRAPALEPNVTAVGCITQAPDTTPAPPTGHEQGAAKGLTLARATIKSGDGRAAGAPPRSAVPGSLPAGAGSGTTDAAPPRQPVPVEQSFWLVGTKSGELTRFLGRRVEVAGTIDERLAANPGMPGVTDAGAAAGRRAVTAPSEAPATAHPSAPSRSISVLSFRVLDEACS
jgi:hypothetical protein